MAESSHAVGADEKEHRLPGERQHALRFGAATALAAAVFLISGISRKTIS
jgi:hypothetical protein